MFYVEVGKVLKGGKVRVMYIYCCLYMWCLNVFNIFLCNFVGIKLNLKRKLNCK